VLGGLEYLYDLTGRTAEEVHVLQHRLRLSIGVGGLTELDVSMIVDIDAQGRSLPVQGEPPALGLGSTRRWRTKLVEKVSLTRTEQDRTQRLPWDNDQTDHAHSMPGPACRCGRWRVTTRYRDDVVGERWRLDDTSEWLSPRAIVDAIDARMKAGELTTYLESDKGRIIGWSKQR